MKFIIHKNHKTSEVLFVIFPQAGATKNTSKKFIELLKKKGNILQIIGGYYGITRIITEKDIENLSFSKITLQVQKKIEEANYTKIVVIGTSFGALQAIDLVSKIKKGNVNLVLINPSFYTKTYLTPIHRNLILFGLKKEGILDSLVFKIFIRIIGMSAVLQSTKDVRDSVSWKSYLLCLKEIVEFVDIKNKYKSEIMGSYTIFGTKDPMIGWYDKKYLDPAKTFFLDAGHSLAEDVPNEVVSLINTRIK